MPSQIFNAGADTFDPAGKGDISFVMISAGGSGGTGGELVGGGGGGGGAQAVGVIPASDVTDATNLAIDVPAGGSGQGCNITIVGGENADTGIALTSGGNGVNDEGGIPGGLDWDTHTWASDVNNGGEGSVALDDIGGGGGGSGGASSAGNPGDGGTGGAAVTGGSAGGDGGAPSAAGSPGGGLGAGGGGGGSEAAGGSGGDGQIVLSWASGDHTFPDPDFPQDAYPYAGWPFAGFPPQTTP